MNEDFSNNGMHEQELSLTDLFLIFWKKRVMIIILSIFGLIIGASSSLIGNIVNSKVSTIVEFQWDGINQGEYPNGEVFDVNNAISATIYSQVIAQLNLDFSSPEIRDQLLIEPILPNDILAAVELALEEGESFVYYPTAFRYTLGVSELGISNQVGKSILNSLINGFTNEFETKYFIQDVILTYAYNSIESYDYSDQVGIIANQISLINTSISRVIPEANTFISSSLGIGFNDILSQTSLFSSIDLPLLNSIIDVNYLSKNSSLSIDRLIFDNLSLQLQLDTQLQVKEELLLLIENYPGSTDTIIIPGLDGTIDTTSYLEVLYTELLSLNQSISGLENKIIFNNSIIENLQVSTIDATLVSFLENRIAELINTLSQLIEYTNTILEEYNRFRIRNVAIILVAATENLSDDLLLSSIIGLLVGGFLSIVVAFSLHSKDEYNKKLKLSKK